jgi:hypothetical protein
LNLLLERKCKNCNAPVNRSPQAIFCSEKCTRDWHHTHDPRRMNKPKRIILPTHKKIELKPKVEELHEPTPLEKRKLDPLYFN